MNVAWTKETSGVLPQVANAHKNKYTCQRMLILPYKCTLLHKKTVHQVLMELQNVSQRNFQ